MYIVRAWPILGRKRRFQAGEIHQAAGELASMRLKPAVCAVAAVLLLVGALQDQPLQASGWSFGNTDVLALLQEGVSDLTINRRIMEVQTAIFRFEPDDLTALKNAGASLGVLSAMLTRARKSSGSNFGPDIMPTFKSLKADTLPLITRQGQQELGLARGEYMIEGLGYHPNTHLDYPGLHASIRTTDQRPSLLVRSESDPTRHYYIGKLFPALKSHIRVLKIQVEMRAFRNVLVPDKDCCMIAYTATEEEKGVWRITPKADLEPGEYGALDGVRLFAFGVDLQGNTSSPSSQL